MTTNKIHFGHQQIRQNRQKFNLDHPKSTPRLKKPACIHSSVLSSISSNYMGLIHYEIIEQSSTEPIHLPT